MTNITVSLSDNIDGINEIKTIEDLCNSYDYTMVYSLSISNCLGCYNSRILSLNEFIIKKKEKVNIIYLFQENLSKNELKILNDKYKDGIICSRFENNISDFLHLNTNEMFILLDSEGKELFREKLHLINTIDDSLLESQVLKISSPIKLKSNDNIFIAPSRIQIKKNRLYVLDRVQNIINTYNSLDGEALYSISIPNEIEDYFKNIDSLYNWKWDHVQPPDIQNFCIINDTLEVFYKVYSIEVNFEKNENNNYIDTNLIIYPNILVAKYFHEKLTSIKYFQNYSYNFDLDLIQIIDSNYIVSGYEKIENNFPYVENPDSVSILLITDSDFKNIKSIVKKEDIQNATSNKYYSFFGINSILIDDNNIFVLNMLNSRLLLIENIKEKKKHQITSIKPYGIIKKNFDLINSQDIKPWDFLKNPDKYNLPSNTLDIGVNEQNYIVFSSEKNSYNLIQNIQALTYNKNGTYKRTYQINYDEKDDIYDFKYAGYDDDNVFVLIKWKNIGWCLNSIPIK